MSMKFIDISGWQAGIDVAKVVKNGGLGAVVVKATEGVNYVDRSCDKFVQQCIDNDIPFGFYHFARNNNASTEAEYFNMNTAGYDGYGIPILDWEDGQSVEWVNEFVERYHQLTGAWPWIYANPWRFRQGEVNGNCGRWVAGYPSNGITDINYGQSNSLPSSYNVGLVCAWQFSSSVRIQGYDGNLDGDVFYGDKEAWAKYALGSASSDDVEDPSDGSEKSIDQLADEVISGAWGNDDDRKKRLVEAGYDYDAVQAKVNEKLSSKKSVSEIVDEVIDGKWGNGEDRVKNLNAAGYDSDEVQKKVNEKLGATSAVYYIVKSGDTLSGIAQKYGTTYTKLAQMNGISDPNKIYVDQNIRVR